MSTNKVQTIFNDRFKQVMDGIELYDGIKIRSFGKQDITNFKKCVFIPHGFQNNISLRSFLLEKIVGEEDERIRETASKMRKIILALQLFKEGRFFGDDVFYFTEGGRFKSNSREETPLSSDLLRYGYALDFEEILELRKLINHIQAIDFEKHKNLDLACRRFQFAHQKFSNDDRIIDNMIAFEALFLKGKKRNQSKGKKIAIACSDLLGNTAKEKEEIKDTLNTAYSVRNKIVLEGEYQGDINPFSISDKLEDYLRASIVKLIDMRARRKYGMLRKKKSR